MTTPPSLLTGITGVGAISVAALFARPAAPRPLSPLDSLPAGERAELDGWLDGLDPDELAQVGVHSPTRQPHD